MWIKSIEIVLSPSKDDSPKANATHLHFENGVWQVNGAFYPRYGKMMQAIWALCRDATKEQNDENHGN